MRCEKDFDAVKLMRELREQLNEQFAKMSFEEQRRFIAERTKNFPLANRKEADGTPQAA